jgi:dienelactone hydrolase
MPWQGAIQAPLFWPWGQVLGSLQNLSQGEESGAHFAEGAAEFLTHEAIMNLNRVKDLKASDGHSIPALLLTPDVSPRGGAVVLHAYGGTKEQMMGVAFGLLEKGIACLVPDLCGHGENHAEIGARMLEEMEVGIHYVRRFGATSAVGISLGGRLALMSSADCMVAVSPAVVAQISPQGKWMFENFPSPAVREPYSGYVTELLDQLGPVREHARPCLLLYAERDIPMILEGAAGLKAELSGAELRYVTKDIRPDIKHDNGLVRYLPRWFNHGELKFNAECVELAAEWAAVRLAGFQHA